MNKKISPKIISLVFGVLVICFVIGFYVLAWTEPTQAPPGCPSGQPGCDAPVNVGPTSQEKLGALTIKGGFESTGVTLLATSGGNVGIGTTSPGQKLDVNGNIVASGTICDSGGANCIGAGGGKFVGSAYNSTNSTAQITTTIPGDNTIPQITEGQEILSRSYTPIFADSIINVEVVVNIGGSGTDSIGQVALFKVGTSNALATAIGGDNVGSGEGHWSGPITLRYQFVSGTISPIDFRVRMGYPGGGYLNRQQGAIIFGGTMRSHIYVTEIRP